MMKLPLSLLAIAAAAAACSGGAGTSESEARRVADAFITRKYAMGDLSELKITARETGGSWTITYDAPNENWIGGPLFVTVDKKSGKVIDHWGYQ